MTDTPIMGPIMGQPRVEAALRELDAALRQAAKRNGREFSAAALVVALDDRGETAMIGCQCEGCTAKMEYTLADTLAKRQAGVAPDRKVKPAAGMH